MIEQVLTMKRTAALCLMGAFCSLNAQAQKILVKGNIADATGEPLIGATVKVKGDDASATISDMDGNFQINVPSENASLVVSYIGMQTQTIKVGKKRQLKVTLTDDNALGEVVVVGYGQQKKASIVGSIAQTDAKTLSRHAGISSLGQALTGNLPGVITSASTGMPGEEDPKIVIRTQTSWNSSDPLVLVDGVERSMSTVDLSSVESISVLKDASATAVYGVKGGNGVILITTKRGQEGKAAVHIKANATTKVVSKLPEKYDSYDTLLLLNRTVERELGISSNAWGSYTPMEVIDKYRHPANSEEWDRYPNVDWQKELFNTTARSYSASADVSGGTKFVKYFAAVDFVHEGDLFKTFTNDRGYDSGFSYNRLNMRANLDFNLTKTTQFSTNLFGSNGVRNTPWLGSGGNINSFWASVYKAAPDAMRPIYSDGTYGFYSPRNADCPNSVQALARSGSKSTTNTQITTDFVLTQKLDFVTKGLKFTGKLSFDNTMVETDRGISDLYMDPQRKWINPDSGDVTYEQDVNYYPSTAWTTSGGSVSTGSTYRRLYYLLQLDWNRKFGAHEVTAMGVFNRNRYTTGSDWTHYREDWVFRATYNYAMRYFAEFNGCYNGSEQFSSNYRFKFFPSASVGWMLTEEPFMKNLRKYIDMFKIRASWGRIGDDNMGGSSYMYQDEYSYGGTGWQWGTTQSTSPYTIYRQSKLGNPNLHWETSEKKNLGFDFGFLGGLITGSLDIFHDHRSDILVTNRTIPSYFGTSAPVANLGVVDGQGYELSLKANKSWNKNLRTWLNFNMTHATNKVKFADDPDLRASYRKTAGYAINQVRSYIDNGYIRSWDDYYGSPILSEQNDSKLTGDYLIADFNGDGQVDTNDQAPYKYSSIPQNTFSTTLGVEWKGLSVTVQFYGVSNVTREVSFPTFEREVHLAFNEGAYYEAAAGSGTLPLPRWTTVMDSSLKGTRYYYDGSYLRLKNAEIAYTFKGNWVKKAHLNSLRVYLNGDNLLLWTKMPDDRENNFSGSSSDGAYPTVRRFNLGFDLTF